MLSKQEIKTLCHVWEIMNGIRAADGAPRNWCEDYFSDLVEKLKDVIESNDGHTEHGVHCHPFLYKKYEDLKKD